MARNWMEPPAWWVKYKPLRWVLGAVLLYWGFSTLMPRLKEDAPVTAEKPVEPVASAPAPAPLPPAPAAPAEVPKPPPAVPATAVKPQPPKPVEKPPATAAAPKPAPVAPPKPAPATPQKPTTTAPPKPPPAPAAKPEPPVQAQAKPAPVADPGARYTQVESERVSLINGLRSYDSVETLRALLEKAGYAVNASTIEKPSDDRYPPYRNDTLVVSSYKHGEFEGKLTLEFFNDRLYQSYFEPAKGADYLGWLRTQGVTLPVKRTGRSSL
ncbi:MAG: hypothetical protein ACRES4_08005, partial [Nevskiales bacterium]